MTDLQVDPALRAFVADELLPGLDLDPELVLVHLRGPAGAVRRPDRRAARPPRRAAGADRRLAPGARRRATSRRWRPSSPRSATCCPPESPQINVSAGRPGDRRDRRPAAGGARHRAAVRAERRQRPVGLALRRALRHRRLPLDHELERGYDERRGAQVIAEADQLLDELFPLADGQPRRRHRLPRARTARSSSRRRAGAPAWPTPAQFAGYRAADGRRAAQAVLLRRNGLHVELTIDPEHRVGRQHHAGCRRRRCSSRRSPRSSTSRTRSPRSTAPDKAAPTAPGSA